MKEMAKVPSFNIWSSFVLHAGLNNSSGLSGLSQIGGLWPGKDQLVMECPPKLV